MRMEAGVRTWDASGDRGTPMRELREERGLKVCRRGMSAGLDVAKSLLIVWEQCVVRFEVVDVNKDVMYPSNIDVARL